MTSLNWSKGPAQPDPARIISVNEWEAFNDVDIARFRRAMDKKYGTRPGPSREPRMSFSDAMRGRGPSEAMKMAKRIKVVEKSGRSDADRFIHDTAVMALRHAEQHGDATAALRLCVAVPTGPRRGKLVRWFERFSPVVVLPERAKCGFRDPRAKAFRPFAIDAASSAPFYLG